MNVIHQMVKKGLCMARVSKEYYEFRKREIIDAALKVCEQKTVSSMTMQDIIDATGFSQGAIYRYYKNIDEILTDLLSRIHIEQYESIDKLNETITSKYDEIAALRGLPLNKETIEKRRAYVAAVIREIHELWADELTKFMYPHKKIEFEFLVLANNYPERARDIFPKVIEGKDINLMFSELAKEIEDGVITPRISLEEFRKYNDAVYHGILNRAFAENSLKRNRDFDESNSYDLRKRYETFAYSSCFFLGLEEYLPIGKD